MDTQALDKQIDEELQPKEGDEPVDEETKQFLARKLRLQIMTKGFFAPHHPKKKSKKEKAKVAVAAPVKENNK